MQAVRAVIVGASASGLATAACLDREGVPYVLLEQAEHVGGAWRTHYERLHLHTPKGSSALPHVPFDAELPRYVPRLAVVDYLERYAARLRHPPRLGERVTRIAREEGAWMIEATRGGETTRHVARHVVIATGLSRSPHVVSWPGQDAFRGDVLHSSRYTNGARFAGKRVLVIGFGNSAGEIAIDLHEHGAQPALAVRGGVNVVTRDLFGIPLMTIGRMMKPLPAALADWLAKPLTALTIGDIEKDGLRRLPYGPSVQVREHGQIPFIDIGTLRLIRKKLVAVRRGVERFTETGVRFEDGVEEPYDAVVVATGYRPRLEEILADAASVCDAEGKPRQSGTEVKPGLWFCGFYVSPTGMLHEIGQEARRIARGIARATPAD